MRLKELIEKLNSMYDAYGDIDVQIEGTGTWCRIDTEIRQVDTRLGGQGEGREWYVMISDEDE